jgi:hypothetical protein
MVPFHAHLHCIVCRLGKSSKIRFIFHHKMFGVEIGIVIAITSMIMNITTLLSLCFVSAVCVNIAVGLRLLC